MKEPAVRSLEDSSRLWSYAESGAGRPLLLVHGFPLTHAMWQSQLDGLAPFLHSIAVDLPGCGGTSLLEVDCLPVAGGEAVTMESLADSLASFVDRLSIERPLVFCGLSMGGYVAWQFWARHRKRLGGLILCDTRAAADSAQAAEGRRAMADAVLREGTKPVADAMLPRLLSPATLAAPGDLAARVREMIVQTSPRTVALLQRGMAVRADAQQWLEQIDLPTLLVVGQNDALSPVEEMRRMASRMPRAELVVVPGAGHLAPLEHPAFVNQRIAEFCRSLG
jgi:pimeloyl-ACP methyl ester carboxylesterase